jgi:hypothetical protein
LRPVAWYKFSFVSEVLAVSIIIPLMMEAAITSETSVSFYQFKRRNNPDDNHVLFLYFLYDTHFVKLSAFY